MSLERSLEIQRKNKLAVVQARLQTIWDTAESVEEALTEAERREDLKQIDRLTDKLDQLWTKFAAVEEDEIELLRRGKVYRAMQEAAEEWLR